MQSMFGGGAPQEDMFAKLDQMREIITEVNTQFKDPVCSHFSTLFLHEEDMLTVVGKDDFCLCLYLRVLVVIRDRAINPGIDKLRD
jgi:hypothetical protein